MGLLFTIFYQPIANILIYPLSIFGTASIVLGIVVTVVLTKVLLLKPTIKNTKVQMQMQTITEELKNIRENIKDRKEQAEKTMEVYKKAGINPFTPLLLLITQVPIFLAIFFVIKDMGNGVFSYTETLYSFVPNPPSVDFTFLSVNLADSGSILIALGVGITQILLMQYMQAHITDKSKNMQKMFFVIVLPIITAVASFFLVAAVGMYWFINNLFSILQEILIINRIRKREENSGINSEESGLQPQHP